MTADRTFVPLGEAAGPDGHPAPSLADLKRQVQNLSE